MLSRECGVEQRQTKADGNIGDALGTEHSYAGTLRLLQPRPYSLLPLNYHYFPNHILSIGYICLDF